MKVADGHVHISATWNRRIPFGRGLGKGEIKTASFDEYKRLAEICERRFGVRVTDICVFPFESVDLLRENELLREMVNEYNCRGESPKAHFFYRLDPFDQNSVNGFVNSFDERDKRPEGVKLHPREERWPDIERGMEIVRDVVKEYVHDSSFPILCHADGFSNARYEVIIPALGENLSDVATPIVAHIGSVEDRDLPRTIEVLNQHPDVLFDLSLITPIAARKVFSEEGVTDSMDRGVHGSDFPYNYPTRTISIVYDLWELGLISTSDAEKLLFENLIQHLKSA